MFEETPQATLPPELVDKAYRQSSQPLLPQQVQAGNGDAGYQIFPYYSLGENQIHAGYASLAGWIMQHRQVILDGYCGVLWKRVRDLLQEQFDRRGLAVQWIDVSTCMRPAADIQYLVEPFLGTPGSVWGTRCTLQLEDLFDPAALGGIGQPQEGDLAIVYGTGAALADRNAPLVYLEVPRNEIQYRMRAGSVANLGCAETGDPAEAYKRSYFVDWVLVNRYKKKILPHISVVADTQWADSLTWILSDALREGLSEMSHDHFRVRPWFEPGAWGGQWIKDRLAGINPDEVNYAWSFEMIVPENGLVLESSGLLLEVPFDLLMFTEGAAVLGRHAAVFGDLFPIRFDFLDTWEGGNLSIQCHPSLEYIRQEFGEKITQDETYYILDCKDGANVYLGFQEGIHPDTFRAELENSRDNNQAIQIEQYVQSHKARKHDLFLIPNGTVHSAGANNLVLEISATPYIFTFKMYDWLRLDLNGRPRAINIDHAFRNLRFERQGRRVQEELISKPAALERGEGWKLVHLPTHADHFYDVHRLEFDHSIQVETAGLCHVLMLVEGTSILLKTATGKETRYHYAETFAVPAAAETYTLTNEGGQTAKVIKAFIKPGYFTGTTVYYEDDLA